MDRSGVYPSVIPPAPAPRKPALAKCSPERYAAHVAVAQWFSDWCRRHNVTVRDLADTLGVTIAVARSKLSGESPLTIVDLGRFPVRYRNELVLGLSMLFHESDHLRAHG
jgi:hypothetical protein